MSSDRRAMGISEIGDEAVVAVGMDLEPQPIGSYLRRQRKLRGISIEDLARTTRIPLRSLERLESGSFDHDVDGFVRGFVRTVADALGLDPNDTVARMLREPAPEESASLDFSGRLPRAVLGLAVAVALIAVIGLVRVAVTSDDEVHVSSPQADVVYRRDPVRALADAQAASTVD
jgi:transcriptional regulator with XRE-family HTH domain